MTTPTTLDPALHRQAIPYRLTFSNIATAGTHTVCVFGLYESRTLWARSRTSGSLLRGDEDPGAARNIPRLEAFSPDEARIYPIVAAPRDR